LRALPLKVGKDFNVITLSIDPRETPALAANKKRNYLDRYGHPEAAGGWAFLTGTDPAIHAVSDAVGFHFAYDPDMRQFAHAAGIMVLTPEGRVARYFYGVEYPVQDVQLGLVDASHGKIGNLSDKLLLYCYHYDPTTGRYGLAVMRVLQVSGAATVLAIGIGVAVLLGRERRAAGRGGSA
ncbi:MAG TPA: SCO family protein, partial [Candidatus Sulfotelmatobacter sp.]|nr:SCO family protein [Candidatus Sulfotelmatobacter sp.]